MTNMADMLFDTEDLLESGESVADYQQEKQNLHSNLKSYSDGYDDGIRNGKIEILNDLMKEILIIKSTSTVVSCSTIIDILNNRKNSL